MYIINVCVHPWTCSFSWWPNYYLSFAPKQQTLTHTHSVCSAHMTATNHSSRRAIKPGPNPPLLSNPAAPAPYSARLQHYCMYFNINPHVYISRLWQTNSCVQRQQAASPDRQNWFPNGPRCEAHGEMWELRSAPQCKAGDPRYRTSKDKRNLQKRHRHNDETHYIHTNEWMHFLIMWN